MKSLGQVGYEAYLKSADGRSLVNNTALPPFECLNPRIQQAWEESAKAIEAEIKANCACHSAKVS